MHNAPTPRVADPVPKDKALIVWLERIPTWDGSSYFSLERR